MVEEVEEFTAKLQPQSFDHGKVLEQRIVHVPVPRSTQLSAPPAADGPDRFDREDAGIEPLRDLLLFGRPRTIAPVAAQIIGEIAADAVETLLTPLTMVSGVPLTP